MSLVCCKVEATGANAAGCAEPRKGSKRKFSSGFQFGLQGVPGARKVACKAPRPSLSPAHALIAPTAAT